MYLEDKERCPMVKIVSFILCDQVMNIPNNAGPVSQLIAPQIALRPPFIPTAISFGLAVGVSGVDLQKPQRIKYTMTDTEDNVIHDSGETEFDAFPIADPMPKEYQGFTLTADFRNIEIKAEGVYRFNLYINDELVGVRDIPVYKRAELE